MLTILNKKSKLIFIIFLLVFTTSTYAENKDINPDIAVLELNNLEINNSSIITITEEGYVLENYNLFNVTIIVMADNVTIKNNYINRSVNDDIIQISNHHDITIENNKFFYSKKNAIDIFFNSHSNRIINNTFEYIGSNAIYLSNSNFNVILNNSILHYENNGVYLSNSNNNTIVNNIISLNDSVRLYRSHDNRAVYNQLSNIPIEVESLDNFFGFNIIIGEEIITEDFIMEEIVTVVDTKTTTKTNTQNETLTEYEFTIKIENVTDLIVDTVTNVETNFETEFVTETRNVTVFYGTVKTNTETVYTEFETPIGIERNTSMSRNLFTKSTVVPILVVAGIVSFSALVAGLNQYRKE